MNLSNLTVNNRPLGLFYDEPAPSYIILDNVVEPHYNQYYWKIPIDILLNCKTNNLVLDITAYTTQTGTGAWDGGGNTRLYAEKVNYTSEYTLMSGVNSFEPIDSNGYRGMTISNWTNASLGNIQDWKNNGETYVLLHSPAAGTSNFVQPPVCKMTYTA